MAALTDLLEAHPGEAWWATLCSDAAAKSQVWAAWSASEDPVALLHTLDRLHPLRHRQACERIAEELPRVPRLSSIAKEQRQWRSGERLNGRDVFGFLALAQRVHFAIEDARRQEAYVEACGSAPQELGAGEVRRQTVGAVRRIVPDPFVFQLPATVATGDADSSRPRFGPGQRVRVRDEGVVTITSACWAIRLGGWFYEIEGELRALRSANDFELDTT